MGNVMTALMRSFASLSRPGLWRYLLAPAAFSLVLWVVLAWFGLGELVQVLMDNPPMTLLAGWGLVWLAHFLAYVGGWMVIFALAYLTTAMIAAVFVLPWLLEAVTGRDYPELAKMGKDSFVSAVINSVLATLIFVVGWVASLPLWLIPGLGLILPLLLLAWFNRKTFAYDCLAVHATDEEWRTLRRQHGGPLFMLGLVLALLAHIPLVGLLVPALSALAYIHYCMEALRQQRGGALVSGSGVVIEGDGRESD